MSTGVPSEAQAGRMQADEVVPDYDEGAWCAPDNPTCGACPTCAAAKGELLRLINKPEDGAGVEDSHS